MGHFFPITSRHNVRTYFLKLGNTSRPSSETPIHTGFPVSETSRHTSRQTSRDTSRMTSRPYNRGMWHRERMTGGRREVSATDLPSQNPFPQRRFKRKREVGRSTTRYCRSKEKTKKFLYVNWSRLLNVMSSLHYHQIHKFLQSAVKMAKIIFHYWMQRERLSYMAIMFLCCQILKGLGRQTIFLSERAYTSCSIWRPLQARTL